MLDPRLHTAWLVNAAAGAAAATVRAPMARPRAAVLTRLIVTDLEVVTVTHDSAILTWTTRERDRSGALRPAAADTEVLLAPADGRAAATTRYFDARRTAHHYAEISGLEPGRRYRFTARSDGVRAVPGRTWVTRRPGTPELTGVFRTAPPPPGRLLRTIALANDLHWGEERSGLIVAGLPPGLRHDDGHYPQVMTDALLHDIRRPARAADHLVVTGDLTDRGSADQVAGIRARLDGWGAHGRDYLVCRGNHDVARGRKDHWGWAFHAHQRLVCHELGGLRLIGLDTTRGRGAGGTISAAQLTRLRELLAAAPDQPTMIFGHHPATRYAALSNPGGPGFVLDRASAQALRACYRTSPGVFLHQAGHTHRNRMSRPDSGRVEFLEVAAVKEYPGGYALLRIYERGYTVHFHRIAAAAALAWTDRTRGQYFGLQPDHALGTLADRNHRAAHDFSGVTRAH
ncbi:metallophosphoesterase [Nocardia neocaledoniensis]|uniref:metallophosphoesterase n=1 Tax=Nocardia neocaledoniensis TaxID=236511 RepID=UPI0033CA6630